MEPPLSTYYRKSLNQSHALSTNSSNKPIFHTTAPFDDSILKRVEEGMFFDPLHPLAKMQKQTLPNSSQIWKIWKITQIPYVMSCVIWYQSLFGVFIIVGTHTDACQYFFFTFLLFLSMSQHGILMGLSNVKVRIPFKRVNIAI